MRTEESAGVIVYRERAGIPEFLIIKHATGKHWGFPKGKVEAGETPVEAALREVREETGLSVSLVPGFKREDRYNYRRLGQEWVEKTVIYLLGLAKSDDVKLSSEHSEFRWLSAEECIKSVTFRSNKELVREASEFISKT